MFAKGKKKSFENRLTLSQEFIQVPSYFRYLSIYCCLHIGVLPLLISILLIVWYPFQDDSRTLDAVLSISKQCSAIFNKDFKFYFSDCCSNSCAQLFWLSLFTGWKIYEMCNCSRCVVGWLWLATRCPPSHSCSPSINRMEGGNTMKSSHGSRSGQGDHLPSQAKQTQFEKIIYCQLIVTE